MVGSCNFIFCARRSVMMILKLSESFAKPLVMAKLNMAYLSSLKNPAKPLSSSLPVSPSRVLRALSTSLYHLVPKHLWATWPRPEQSHLLPEIWGLLSQWHRHQTTTPEASSALTQLTFLRDFTLYMTTNDAIIWKMCLNYTACSTVYCLEFLLRIIWF